MNTKITRSLELLTDLAKVGKPLFYPTPNYHELRKELNCFHNLSNWETTTELPEEAFFADFEWQCSYDGSQLVAGIETQKKFPFCGQFVGLSGTSYVWFGDGETLCSVGNTATTFVVHNIAADRPMISESYCANTNNGLNFFCTMSAHLLLAGLGGQQTWNHSPGETKLRSGGLKNLVDTYNFWSAADYPEVYNRFTDRGKVSIDTKDIRDLFYRGDMKTILSRLDELMDYGMSDVNKLVEIFPAMHAAWLDNLPAKESQYFFLKRAKVNYSLSEDYNEWFYNTETLYQTVLTEIEIKVKSLCNSIAESFKTEVDETIEAYKLAPPQSCFTKGSKYTKLQKKYENLYKLHAEFNPQLAAIVDNYTETFPCIDWNIGGEGYPNWFSTEVTSKSVNFQLLLKPKYLVEVGKFVPVLYERKIGFYYETEKGTQKITSPKKGVNTKDNCGSLFSKDFLEYWENGTLVTESSDSKEIVKLTGKISYWISVRSRLAELVN